MHCSSACLLKLNCENGIVKQITSAGDIPAEGSFEEDEALFPPQRRACARGYAEIDHLYSPYRVTQPLLQTGARGNRSTFKPISWGEAINRTADFYHDMMGKSEKLGYLPLLEKNGVGAYLGRTLATFGNSSSGCVDGAIFAALGDKESVKGHPPIDLFRTNYLIIWANNPAETLPYLSFWLIKAKERGIPITIVDGRYTDSVAAYATGYGKVPALINPRPGTDGALLSAMAYVIWKHGLQDEKFIRNYCFGFYPGESVISESCGTDPVTHQPFAGRKYTVPKGESFEEYLRDLEREHGGYQGVLSWCRQVTSVPEETTEAFALAYAKAKPAFLFSRYNGGAQRSYNGLYFCWMLIALSAMTGNIVKSGGGFGELCGDDETRFRFSPEPEVVQSEKYAPILVSQFTTDRLILTGRDGRSAEQLRADVLAMNHLDLGKNAKIELEGMVKGMRNGNPFNQNPHINLHRQAWEKLKFILTYEREFSPMAAMSDLILPSAGQYEGVDSLQQHRFGGSDTYLLKGCLQPPGEAKTDREIQRLLAKALGLAVLPEEYYVDLPKRQWEQAKLSDEIHAAHPDYQKPEYEQIVREGLVIMPEQPEDAAPCISRFAPGKFPTDTGRINFYSPFIAERKRSDYAIARACYVPLPQGAETVKDETILGNKGKHYPLQMINPHVKTKADATFDNVSSLQKVSKNALLIHPEDADQRKLSEGQMAWIYNDYGCIRLPIHRTVSVPVGVVAVPHGTWYCPDEEDRYMAWYDSDGDGKAEMHDTAVDIGGNANTITPDRCSGLLDPFIVGMGLNANGNVCEVSDRNPDKDLQNREVK